MPTMVFSTIGSAPGATYPDPYAWEADTDNDLVVLDQQQIGLLLAQTHPDLGFLVLAGAVTSATQNRILSTAPGAYHSYIRAAGAVLAMPVEVGEPNAIIENMNI